MAVSYLLVDGPGFAAEASSILEESWEPPAVRYLPDFLAWELSFPSPVKMPSVAAFEGSDPIGFAGASARRFKHRHTTINAAVVSFVAVRPGWRGQGVAAGMYRALLRALADLDLPVVTFAVPGSAGEGTLRRAYPAAGFHVTSIGTYSNYAFVSPQEEPDEGWTASFTEDPGLLSSQADQLSACDESALWARPQGDQVEHYLTDPRPRKLIVVRHASTGVCGAGFIVRSELRTFRGIERAPTLDSLWMANRDAAGLRALLRLASVAWPSPADSNVVVMCPNLRGFEDSALRTIGVRKTGAQFGGFFCVPRQWARPMPEWTNVEIV